MGAGSFEQNMGRHLQKPAPAQQESASEWESSQSDNGVSEGHSGSAMVETPTGRISRASVGQKPQRVFGRNYPKVYDDEGESESESGVASQKSVDSSYNTVSAIGPSKAGGQSVL